MQTKPLALLIAAALSAAAAPAYAAETATPDATSGATAAATPAFTSNPFYAPSTLYLHAPPFDKIKDEHYAPAFEDGMASSCARSTRIANNAEAADLRQHHRRDGAHRPGAGPRRRPCSST